MAEFKINAGHVSLPRVVGRGNVVNIWPSAGATAIVEYTTASSTDIANGVALWRPWPKGSVTTATSDMMTNDGFIRVTARNGMVTCAIDDMVSSAIASLYRTDWANTSYTPTPSTAPATLAIPVITGTPTEGELATATAGTFSGNPAPNVVRDWKIDGVSKGSTYTYVVGDATKTATVTDTANNGVGSPAVATSAGVVVAAAAVLRNIAAGGMFYPDTILANLTWAGSRTPFYNRAGANLTQAAILDGNKWGTFGNVETNGPAGDTIKEYAIEYPEGTFTRITSGGANTMTLPQGTAMKQTDLCTLAVPIPDNAKAWVRMFSTGPAGHCVCFARYSSDGTAQGQAGTSGALNYVMGGGQWTTQPSGAANQTHASPLAVMGYTTKDSYIAYGDSESVGTFDIVPAGTPLQSPFDRSIGLTNPIMHIGIYGSQLRTFINNRTDRMGIAAACGNMSVGQYGINDTTGTTDTAVQIVANANTVAGYFKALGMKVGVGTLVQVTGGSWGDSASQTLAPTNQKRIDINTSLLTGGAPNIDKVWDFSQVLETVGYPNESGIWKSPGYTPDGTHLSAIANAAAATLISANPLNAPPA